MYNFFINSNDLLKILIFIKNHSKSHIQSQNNSKIFARSLGSRILGVISAFININIDRGYRKLGNLTSKEHQI